MAIYYVLVAIYTAWVLTCSSFLRAYTTILCLIHALIFLHYLSSYTPYLYWRLLRSNKLIILFILIRKPKTHRNYKVHFRFAEKNRKQFKKTLKYKLQIFDSALENTELKWLGLIVLKINLPSTLLCAEIRSSKNIFIKKCQNFNVVHLFCILQANNAIQPVLYARIYEVFGKLFQE